MKRQVQLVLLCEDRQHESFLLRFLAKRGVSKRGLRVERAPGPEGAADAWVLARFPTELRAIRTTAVSRALISMIDGDRSGVTRRHEQLGESCEDAGIPRRTPEDRAAVLVPTWNLETWLAYLDGETVDESKDNYPKYQRSESECQRHVEALAEMCEAKTLRQPAPPSLEAGCEEVKRLAVTLEG